jgi:acetyl-CoA acyltransferase
VSETYIVDALRTPVGRYTGSLAGIRADHLAAHVLNGLLQRNSSIAAEQIDDVIFGCVTQVGEQSANIARTALLSAGWPDTVPGLTIDRKCGSGEVAVHLAKGLISSGAADLVVAGGAENMSRVKMGGNREIYGEAFGWMIEQRFELTGQGEAAERLADKWQLSREDLDDFAVRSHILAAKAAAAGYFDNEILPVPIKTLQDADAITEREELAADETIRPGSNVEKLATLKTSFREAGRLTAGNSSQISDGAALLLLASENACKEFNLKPRARVLACLTVGSDPTLMLTGPIAATRKVLAKAGLSIADIDLFEINEAFATVPLVWAKEMQVSHERLNVNGGAIALGHPLGASGARIMTSMLNELERRGGRYALQAICCAGGMGTATIIERL